MKNTRQLKVIYMKRKIHVWGNSNDKKIDNDRRREEKGSNKGLYREFNKRSREQSKRRW